MKIRHLCVFFFLPFLTIAQKDAYLFSYFIKNGEDGLHFAYSTDGQTWQALKKGGSFLQPTIGKDKLMRDPCIYQDKNGTYHMVWTSGWWDKTIGYASSQDLINWSEQRAISVMEHESTAKNSWAPEISYDDKTKLFLVFWATTIPGRHSDVADSEREKGLNHRMYYVTTPDFKTFSETKIFFNPDFSVIDATIFKKGKQYYMFLKNENPKPAEKNIRITQAKSALGPYPTQVSAPITGNYWAEGPTVIQIGEYAYVYFDKYTKHKYGAVRSKDLKTWEDVSNQVKFPEGICHGTAFKVPTSVLESLKKL